MCRPATRAAFAKIRRQALNERLLRGYYGVEEQRMPRRRSLVIVESGARAPLALDLEDIVLVQHVGEAPRAFSQRVVARHRQCLARRAGTT